MGASDITEKSGHLNMKRARTRENLENLEKMDSSQWLLGVAHEIQEVGGINVNKRGNH
ncbi:MAG: hypothetical protein ACFFCS_23300 [Candidatus Hodarchaeota archaeon]